MHPESLTYSIATFDVHFLAVLISCALSLQAERRIILFVPNSVEAIREHMAQWPRVEVSLFPPMGSKPLLGLLTYRGILLAPRGC